MNHYEWRAESLLMHACMQAHANKQGGCTIHPQGQTKTLKNDLNPSFEEDFILSGPVCVCVCVCIMSVCLSVCLSVRPSDDDDGDDNGDG